MEKSDQFKRILIRIYGERIGLKAFDRIFQLIKQYPVQTKTRDGYFSQDDVILITYGDTLCRENQAPLATFHEFARKYLADTFSAVHFLPFFPFSSDDGFSVIDYYSINPELGSWDHINSIGSEFRLMFDHVLNHISSKSEWFNHYLDGQEGYKELAIEVDPLIDLSMVTRPRALPLLTEYTKKSGKSVHVWTTFSADQIDLNYNDIDVLEKVLEVLLFYISQGATMIRFDAIAYLWKEIGTSCIHLPQTHDMVKLFRCLFDLVAPDVIIITETNVPHDENISYFGNGSDEAQMVYNFTLPPLLIYTFLKENSMVLSKWAKGLVLESEKNTFFNFTASHDGIGVRPLEGILPSSEIDYIVEHVKQKGGDVSYKKNLDGSESPYELNITYVDALLETEKESGKPDITRFMAAQAIQYVLPGIPATYIHSILGSRNWKKGVIQTRRARTINREKLNIDLVLSELENPDSLRFQIFNSYVSLIRTRKKQTAFHPNAMVKILDLGPGIFGIIRYHGDQTIYALTNISSHDVSVKISEDNIPKQMQDLLTMEWYDTGLLVLEPYQYLWLNQV